jgi:hypothetical protein
MPRLTVLAVAVLVAACSLPPAGRLFRTSLSNGDGYAQIPIALGDETDLVTGIEAAPAGAEAPGAGASVRADLAGTNAFIVTWMGGLCATDAALSFTRAGSGFALHLEGHQPPLASCSMVGIGRDLRIRTSTPIPLDLIAATGNE